LTTSSAEKNILRAYNLAANFYATRPVGLGEFTKIIEALDHVWFIVVNLPTRTKNGH
jgi:two-component system, chemotaxis family, response regulator Rcp1